MAKFIDLDDTSTNGGGGGSPAESDFTILIDEVSATLSYVGYALPGTIASASLWKIKRIQTVGAETFVEYAGGTKDFDKVWDDRTSYTYS